MDSAMTLFLLSVFLQIFEVYFLGMGGWVVGLTV
jgi:hypothetical protein